MVTVLNDLDRFEKAVKSMREGSNQEDRIEELDKSIRKGSNHTFIPIKQHCRGKDGDRERNLLKHARLISRERWVVGSVWVEYEYVQENSQAITTDKCEIGQKTKQLFK